MSLKNNAVQFAKDWEKPIDFDRLRAYRLKRLQEAMEKRGIQALVLFKPEDFRYATGIRGEWFTINAFLRWTICPVKGLPWHWELGGDYGRVAENMREMMPGRVQISIPLQHTFTGSASQKMKEHALKEFIANIKKVLKDNGLSLRGPIGLDNFAAPLIQALQDANIDFVDSAETLSEARYIKSEDELQIMRIACSIADAGFHTIKTMIKPGVREMEVWAEVCKTTIGLGAENTIGICTSGGRTNPYYRTEGSDRIVCWGDMFISDIVTCYLGYYTCFVRSFVVGNKPTAEQKALYQECYQSLYSAINVCKAGASSHEISKALPEQTWENWSLQVAHGIGTSLHEMPLVLSMYSKDNPIKLEKNSVLAVETYAGKKGSTQGVRLEEDFIIIEDGVEMLSKYPFEESMLE